MPHPEDEDEGDEEEPEEPDDFGPEDIIALASGVLPFLGRGRVIWAVGRAGPMGLGGALLPLSLYAAPFVAAFLSGGPEFACKPAPICNPVHPAPFTEPCHPAHPPARAQGVLPSCSSPSKPHS